MYLHPDRQPDKTLLSLGLLLASLGLYAISAETNVWFADLLVYGVQALAVLMLVWMWFPSCRPMAFRLSIGIIGLFLLAALSVFLFF